MSGHHVSSAILQQLSETESLDLGSVPVGLRVQVEFQTERIFVFERIEGEMLIPDVGIVPAFRLVDYDLDSGFIDRLTRETPVELPLRNKLVAIAGGCNKDPGALLGFYRLHFAHLDRDRCLLWKLLNSEDDRRAEGAMIVSPKTVIGWKLEPGPAA